MPSALSFRSCACRSAGASNAAFTHPGTGCRVTLLRYLGNLGYGTRRIVERLLEAGRVTTAAGKVCTGDDLVPSHAADFQLWHDEIRVDGVPLDVPPGSVVMLHKPAGYVCSTRDTNALVYDLLPARFQHRSPIIAPVGRLDRDTTGLLLLTDDGKLLHRLTSPRTHLPKTYRATLAQPLAGHEAAPFASGTFMLEGETKPLAPATLEVLGNEAHAPTVVRLTITEGRYHQVRRMFAAVGNHVTTLHREAIGPIALDDLPEGKWHVLAPREVSLLATAASRPSTL